MSRAISCLKLVHSELKPPRRQTNSMEAGNVRVNPGSSQGSSRLCAVFFCFQTDDWTTTIARHLTGQDSEWLSGTSSRCLPSARCPVIMLGQPFPVIGPSSFEPSSKSITGRDACHKDTWRSATRPRVPGRFYIRYLPG